MLNEFKKPMWNDSYSKEQPWLNYFNNYEVAHCCFGEGGAGSEGAGTDDTTDQMGFGDPGATDFSEADLDDYEDAVAERDMDPDALSTDTPGFTAAEAEQQAAAADALGAQATQAEQQAAIDTTAVDIAMDKDPDLYGYNDLVDMGYFDTRDVAMSASDRQNARSHEAEMKSRGYNVSVTVDKNGTYSYTGPDAFSAAAASVANAARTAADYMSVYGLGTQLDREFGTATDPEFGPALSYNEETARSDRDYAESLAEFNTLNAERSMAEAADPIGAAYAMSEAPSVEDYRNALSSYGATTDRADITNVEDLFSSPTKRATGGFITAPHDYPMVGGDGLPIKFSEETGLPLKYWDDEGEPWFEPNPNIKETEAQSQLPSPEEPSAMKLYFEKLGIGPAIPSPEIETTAPPELSLPNIESPDLFYTVAQERREKALNTPRYQEPSGLNPSIASYAAAYGIPYPEAVKKFAPPSVPAMGGGGLRSLMEYS